MNLLYKAKKPKSGYATIINHKNSTLKLLSLGRIFLSQKGPLFQFETKDRELALILVRGSFFISIRSDYFDNLSYESARERKDIFSDNPTMVYVPKEAEFTIKAKSKHLDMIVFTAPSELRTEPVFINPSDVAVINIGRGNMFRQMRAGILDNVKADKLLVGETFNPQGNWSSWPPHKHDKLNFPREIPYEEIYLFMVKPPQGYGVIRIYTDPEDREPLNEMYVVENNDAVSVPRGYHPIGAPAGYDLCYLWALASEKGRRFGTWSNDPKHRWILEK